MLIPKHTTLLWDRPHVGYVSAAWSPFERQRIKASKAVQRGAVRFASSDYSLFSSVTYMQRSLGWDAFEVSRHLSAATIMYKAVYKRTHLTLPTSVTLAHGNNRSNHPHKFRHIFARTNAVVFLFPSCYPSLEETFPILLLILSLLLTSKRMLCTP